MEKGEGMATIDAWLEGFLHEPAGLWVVLLVSLLLGLRYASDPDHLAAVTTLIASEKDGSGLRKAGSMGFAWGLGRGTSLVLIGLPLVLLGRYLPEPVQQAAETLIGGSLHTDRHLDLDGRLRERGTGRRGPPTWILPRKGPSFPRKEHFRMSAFPHVSQEKRVLTYDRRLILATSSWGSSSYRSVA